MLGEAQRSWALQEDYLLLQEDPLSRQEHPFWSAAKLVAQAGHLDFLRMVLWGLDETFGGDLQGPAPLDRHLLELLCASAGCTKSAEGLELLLARPRFQRLVNGLPEKRFADPFLAEELCGGRPVEEQLLESAVEPMAFAAAFQADDCVRVLELGEAFGISKNRDVFHFAEFVVAYGGTEYMLQRCFEHLEALENSAAQAVEMFGFALIFGNLRVAEMIRIRREKDFRWILEQVMSSGEGLLLSARDSFLLLLKNLRKDFPDIETHQEKLVGVAMKYRAFENLDYLVGMEPGRCLHVLPELIDLDEHARSRRLLPFVGKGVQVSEDWMDQVFESACKSSRPAFLQGLLENSLCNSFFQGRARSEAGARWLRCVLAHGCAENLRLLRDLAGLDPARLSAFALLPGSACPPPAARAERPSDSDRASFRAKLAFMSEELGEERGWLDERIQSGEFGEEPRKNHVEGPTLLLLALEQGSFHEVQALLDHGADPFATCDSFRRHEADPRIQYQGGTGSRVNSLGLARSLACLHALLFRAPGLSLDAGAECPEARGRGARELRLFHVAGCGLVGPGGLAQLGAGLEQRALTSLAEISAALSAEEAVQAWRRTCGLDGEAQQLLADALRADPDSSGEARALLHALFQRMELRFPSPASSSGARKEVVQLQGETLIGLMEAPAKCGRKRALRGRWIASRWPGLWAEKVEHRLLCDPKNMGLCALLRLYAPSVVAPLSDAQEFEDDCF